MEFRALASSSAGNAYVVASPGKAPILLDCGIAFGDIQRALDWKLSTLAGCLLTHAHGDHCKAATELAKYAVQLYASEACLKAVKPAPKGLADLSRSVFAHPVKPREVFAVGPYRCMGFEAIHDSPGTLGFIVDDQDGSRLLYLTDTAYSPFRFEGLTHIAVECNFSREIMRDNTANGRIDAGRFTRTTGNHMSLETLIEMLRANDLSRVEEIHLLHLSDENSDEEAMADAVRRATGRPVFVAAKRS